MLKTSSYQVTNLATCIKNEYIHNLQGTYIDLVYLKFYNRKFLLQVKNHVHFYYALKDANVFICLYGFNTLTLIVRLQYTLYG